ncbi:MAG: hypothetical protein RI563_00665 [Thiohalophilus sp.]|uniref:hypothetical protein n=1 Tax=Thiohalophilus sp. TaxID=3028392 RepID=UPI0028703001|nr:hypothetical protein [Thiohalophilus sp.]MDR9435357.1 hypothetical protein [Thiohalophilus sp.]
MAATASESQENNSMVIRKQAIMVGLSPFMALEECRQAADYWEQHFSRAPRFAIQQFIKQLVTPDNPLWPYRKEMVLNVTKVMALLPREIEVQYAKLFQGEPDFPGAGQGSDQDPAQPVFEQLYQSLLSRLEEEDYPTALRLRKFLRERMLQNGSFSMETRRLNSWLLGIEPILTVNLPREQMRRIVHQAWLGCCEYLGPVTADRLLGQAVAEAEQKTRGEELSPRVLL